MKQIHLENIRSLKDTGAISIQPITLLLGENSSGKSTFLRVFPLLKQSIQKKTNGPILWAGDVDDYVDFGSFDETVTNDGSNSMRLHFSFEIPVEQFSSRVYWDFSRWYPRKEPFSINYSIQIGRTNDRECVTELVVAINGIEIKFSNLQDECPQVFINGNDVGFTPSIYKDSEDNERYYLWRPYSGRSIFGIQLPNIAMWARQSYEKLFRLNKNQGLEYEIAQITLISIGDALFNGITLKELKDIFENSKKGKKDNRETGRMPIQMDKSISTFFSSVGRLNDNEAQSLTQSIELLYFYMNYYDVIEDYLRDYFSQVHYIAPLRATAERYYRLRNSAIDEVDYQGKNLAIFLNSLPSSRMQQFQSWTMRHFGFKTIVTKNAGHLSVEINRAGHEKAINLSDTGFGYSQILPIITQLWELSSRKRPSKNADQIAPLVVAIEQPELHLHPAMQARLAESFIACQTLAQQNGYSLQLILETHSETMINYFGRAIARKKLKPEDIAIILFEKDEKTNQTITQSSRYDSDGFLQDWPIGFFAPED